MESNCLCGEICRGFVIKDVGVSREFVSVGTSVMLPQRAQDISYNALVAAGILMFLIAEQCKTL